MATALGLPAIRHSLWTLFGLWLAPAFFREDSVTRVLRKLETPAGWLLRASRCGAGRGGGQSGHVPVLSLLSVPTPSPLLSSLPKGQTLKPAPHPPSSPCARPLPWCSSDVEEPAGSLRQLQFSTANIRSASLARLRARPRDMPGTQPRAVPGHSSLTVGHRPEKQGQCWTVCSREESAGHPRVTGACTKTGSRPYPQ